MHEFYYLDSQQQVQGPVTLEQLSELHQNGILQDNSLVAPAGSVNWSNCASVLTSAKNQIPPVPPATGFRGEKKTSGLALASLILGLAGFLCSCLTGLPALVCGILALNQIRKSPAMEGRGMAIAGISLGALSLVLLVLSLPAISTAIEKSKQVTELSYCHQVGLMLFAYASDHSGKYPDSLDVLADPKNAGVDAQTLSKLLYKPGTREYRWKLTPGLSTSSPPDTVLLQSADSLGSGRLKGRAVYTVGNSASFVKGTPASGP